MDSKELFDEIESAFPAVKMPAHTALSFHKTDCPQCEYLRSDLEEYRGEEVTGKLIRYLHMELTCLSSAGWRWILPHYLKFCLTPEAEYNTFETASMIYHLGPDPKFQDDAKVRLSSLNEKQIICLAHFLEWLQNHPHWNEYCPDDIDHALKFVRSLQ